MDENVILAMSGRKERMHWEICRTNIRHNHRLPQTPLSNQKEECGGKNVRENTVIFCCGI